VTSLQSPSSTIALASGKVRILADPFEAVGKRFSMPPGLPHELGEIEPGYRAALRQAMKEASAYANSHPKDVLPLLADFSASNRRYSRTRRARRSSSPSTRDFQPLIDVMLAYKIIDKALDASDLIAPAAPRR